MDDKSMIRGVLFTVNQGSAELLPKILKYVDKSTLRWIIVQSSGGTYIKGSSDVEPFPEACMNVWLDNASFSSIIENSLLLLEFVAFTRRQSAEPFAVRPVDYKQYKASACNMAMLICDCGYFEIYIKELELQKQIEKALVEERIQYSYITDENDGRTLFEV